MLFDYAFRDYEIDLEAFSLKVRAATNFEEVVDGMFSGPGFNETLCPYGAALWPASVALARALVARRQALAGRRLLELGCGAGLVSLAAAKLGAVVTASDYHPDVAEIVAHNCALNGVALDYVCYDWNAAAPEKFDIVVGSDLLYDRALTPLVINALAATVNEGGFALLADPQRGQLMSLRQGLARAGFDVRETTQRAELEKASAHCVIFELRR